MEDNDKTNEDEKNFEEEYQKLKNKYLLPNFNELCEDFDIEKISDKDSKFLLREIRRTINEKITAYLHLFETLINPTSPPIFIFSILRGTSDQEKETMKDIYKTLSKMQLTVMKLDVKYDEEQESHFIKETHQIWQNQKPKILDLIKTFETNFENDTISKKSSYFD